MIFTLERQRWSAVLFLMIFIVTPRPCLGSEWIEQGTDLKTTVYRTDSINNLLRSTQAAPEDDVGRALTDLLKIALEDEATESATVSPGSRLGWSLLELQQLKRRPAPKTGSTEAQSKISLLCRNLHHCSKPDLTVDHLPVLLTFAKSLLDRIGVERSKSRNTSELIVLNRTEKSINSQVAQIALVQSSMGIAPENKPGTRHDSRSLYPHANDSSPVTEHNQIQMMLQQNAGEMTNYSQ